MFQRLSRENRGQQSRWMIVPLALMLASNVWIASVAIFLGMDAGSPAMAGGKGKGGGNGAPATVAYDANFLEASQRDPLGSRFPLYANEVQSVGDINDSNEIVGTVAYSIPDPDLPGQFYEKQAACLIADGIVYDLNDLLSEADQALWDLEYSRVINNSGVIGGGATVLVDGVPTFSGFLFWPGENGTPPSVTRIVNGDGITGAPLAINDQAQLIGWYQQGGWKSYLYDGGTGVLAPLTDLIAFPAGVDVQIRARDLNNNGQIVGDIQIDGEWQAFRFTIATGQLDLVPAFRKSRSGLLSAGRGINDAGEMTGSARTGNWSSEAFRRTSGGDVVPLGTLGGESSTGNDINTQGVIVGTFSPEEGPDRYFLHDQTNGMREVVFGVPSNENVEPARINSTGAILGGYRGVPLLLTPQ